MLMSGINPLDARLQLGSLLEKLRDDTDNLLYRLMEEASENESLASEVRDLTQALLVEGAEYAHNNLGQDVWRVRVGQLAERPRMRARLRDMLRGEGWDTIEVIP